MFEHLKMQLDACTRVTRVHLKIQEQLLHQPWKMFLVIHNFIHIYNLRIHNIQYIYIHTYIHTPVHDCICVSTKIEAPLDSHNWSLLAGPFPKSTQVWCSIGGSEEGVPQMEFSIAGLALYRLKWRKH